MATAENLKVAEVKLCTKCKNRPRAGGESDANPWCRECRAAYQREYRDGEAWRNQRMGIIRGVAAMRQELVVFFQQYSGVYMSGAEVAMKIQQSPGPGIAAEELTSPASKSPVA